MNEVAQGVPKFRNTILKTFDNELLGLLHLISVAFKSGQMIKEPGKPIRCLYFLDSGMASITTVFFEGEEVEVGMFGYESVIGTSALVETIQS